MTKRGLGLAVAALLLPLAPAAGETDHAKELVQRGLTDELAWELTASLTSEVGPRPAGSEGDRAAVRWAIAAMERIGLENVRAEPVVVPHWEAGVVEVVISGQPRLGLHATALGGSVGTSDAGIEAEVIEVPDQAFLEAMDPGQLEGKIVFVNHRMERRQDGSDYGNVVKARGSAAWTASEGGAVAVVIRSVGTGTHRFPHTGAMRRREGLYPPIPAAALAVPDADVLEFHLRKGGPVRLSLRSTSRRLPDALSANVIGEVVGSERPQEVVLLAAHLDSWGIGTGAIDDGVGCGIVMAAAHLIAQLPERPMRTIRVVLTANEEFGLSGARRYAKDYAQDLEGHYLALESDLGAGKVWRFDRRFGRGGEPLVQRIHEVIGPLGIVLGSNEASGGPDLIPLKNHLVPVVELRQDGTHYFDYHHTADDTLDKIDPEDLRQNVAAFAAVAYLAAEAEEMLRPIPAYPPPVTP